MLLSTVSQWDINVMAALSVLHGIPVLASCVRSGFDWRSRELNPELAHLYGKVHVKDKNVLLARKSMLTYYRAGQIRHDEAIPTKQGDRDNIQKVLNINICDSVQTDPNHHSLFLMPPDHIQSNYINRENRIHEVILQRLRQVADAPIHESEVPSVSLPLVNSDSTALRPQRKAAVEVLKRNADLFRQELEQTEAELGNSSDDEEYCDWNVVGDETSDDDDD